jgi:hypothetical protein
MLNLAIGSWENEILTVMLNLTAKSTYDELMCF